MGRNQHNQEPENQPAQVLTLKSREDSNQQQIGTLLSIFQTLQPYLLEPRRSVFSEDVPNRPELDGGAAASASATFSALCNRVDAVLADAERWNASGFYGEFEKEVLAVHKAQREFLEAQLQSARQLQRPSFQLKPSLTTFQNGDGAEYFLAYWGDLEKEGHAIIGRGTTPETALLDFDAAFKRTPAEQVIIVAEAAGLGKTPDEPASDGGILLPPSFLKQKPHQE